MTRSIWLAAGWLKYAPIPAKKQNFVDKGLLAALVCCATLGQFMMV
jgi:hypothetical protein